ncbi:MAG: hypothetical protein HFE39_03775 [Clostridiales bacterium]|jgi:hypothetical protein|nr:hypothetical protein [Clostridiales bacterium]
MITLIIGNKGSGKTKKLIQLANESVEKSNGNVVVIEKGAKLTYDITHKARLIDTDQYGVKGFDAFYGFISGICAGNYDVTDILIDSTLKIGGRDMDALVDFLSKLSKLAEQTETKLALSVSADASELPDGLDAIAEKV